MKAVVHSAIRGHKVARASRPWMALRAANMGETPMLPLRTTRREIHS